MPVDEAGERVVASGGEAERGDRKERGADGIEEWHAGREHEAGDDEEATADAGGRQESPTASATGAILGRSYGADCQSR